MISSEKRKLVVGLFFLFISLFNAGFYMMCDVGLYYVLFIVAKHFSGDTGNMPCKFHFTCHVIQMFICRSSSWMVSFSSFCFV